jgi:gluconolactonase
MREIVTGFGLIEGPVWDPAQGLYFSDVPNGGVHLLDRSGAVSLAVARRRGIGGIALHAEGGLIVGGRDVAFVDLDGGIPRPILTQDQIPGSTGFNDLTTDAAGRVYVGSLAFRVFGGEAPQPGKLHVIDLDGRMRTLSDGVMLTNGLGFSPDGRRLYHSDSRANLVRVYEVMADGAVGPWRSFAEMGPDGVPDGLKVAADGSVWVADARLGRVAVFEADGSHRLDLPVPLPMVTSLCFGGDDLKDLYVVTGSDGAPNEASGTVFLTRVEVPGLPAPPARVKVPQGAGATA